LKRGAGRVRVASVSDELRKKLKGEVLAVAVRELLPHFARGGLLLVAPELDLLDVACGIARDEKARVEAWLLSGSLRRCSDDDARELVAMPDKRAQFVIVQPWVIAQLLPGT
jgi:hypothetical protein